MSDQDHFSDPRMFLSQLPFVREFDIQITDIEPGVLTVEMPFAQRFSTPPDSFPASMVGVLGDVGAVSACLSKLPQGWAAATLDYTIKMTGRAHGELLRGKAKALQAGKTTSVGQCDVFSVKQGVEHQCGVVLVTTRNFQTN